MRVVAFMVVAAMIGVVVATMVVAACDWGRDAKAVRRAGEYSIEGHSWHVWWATRGKLAEDGEDAGCQGGFGLSFVKRWVPDCRWNFT